MTADAEPERPALARLLARLGLIAPEAVADPAALPAGLSALADLSAGELRLRLVQAASDPVETRVDPAAQRAMPTPSEPNAPTLIRGASDSGGGQITVTSGPPATTSTAATTVRRNAHGGRMLGRYCLLDRIGLGGMGIVWKAFDPQLDRVIALKQIRRGDEFDAELLARFQREARLAARLRHPRIVAIHDIGSVGDDHYITMEYVEGRTLADRLDETRAARAENRPGAWDRLRDDVRLLAEVAEAIAYAHQEGVIHRDLKPGNVLLDAGDSPRVTDFGLAREVQDTPSGEGSLSNPTLTMAGQVVGTPDYMSPEQAEADGDRIGPRSDVWALGVMLYESLTGRLPFKGERSWKTLLRVIKDEPERPRLRSPHVPADLEAICLKAMEKEPDRRYAGAEAFTADLRRWLSGEPVEARRHGWSYRLWRGMLRHRRKVIAGVMAATLVTAVAVSQWQAAQSRGRILATLRRATGLAVAGALEVRRLGLPQAMASHGPALEAAYRDAAAVLGSSSPEPAWCRGRFARAAMLEEDALRWQEQALAIDPGYTPALYERAVLEAHRYAARRAQVREEFRAERGERLLAAGAAEAARQESTAEPGCTELEARDAELRALKDRLTALLQALEQSTQSGRDRAEGVGPAQLACVQGLLALHSGKDARESWNLARPHFDRALELDPRLEEACDGLVDAASAIGRYADAEAACSRGLAADRGYLRHWLNRAAARLHQGTVGLLRGTDPAPILDAAQSDFGQVLQLDEACAEAWAGRSIVRMNLAVYRLQRGQPSDELLSAAVADAERALSLDDRDSQVWYTRGNCRANLSRAVEMRGEDPTTLLEGAVADYTRALELQPGHLEAWKNRGLATMNQASRASEQGRDPAPLFEAALRDFDQVLARLPTDAGAWKYRAMARRNWGGSRRERGEDSIPDLVAAIQDYEKSLQLDRNDAETWEGLAKACMNLADRKRERREDYRPTYEQAEQACDEALRCNPTAVGAYVTRGHLRTNLASAEMSAGKDPSAEYSRAIDDYQKALALKPEDTSARRSVAMLRANWGAWQLMRQGDPSEQFAAAIAEFDRVIAEEPSALDGWLGRAQVRLNLAVHCARTHQDPKPALEQALADFGAVLERNARYAEAWLNRARGRMRLGSVVADEGGDPRPLFQQAVADLDEFLRLSPGHAQATNWREQLRTSLASAPDSGAWESLAEQAGAALARGEWSRAREQYEQALAAAPTGDAVRTLTPRQHELLITTHYNLACVFAQLAAGKAAATPLSDVEATQLRDRAFDCLRAALALGFADPDLLGQDPDLQGLRDDARWQAIREAAGGQGK